MNEINEEIKLTLNLMQTDIDYEAHSELQCHLACLLEIKRNELQQRLVERSWAEPVTHVQAPYKSVKLDLQFGDEAKPLTTEELKAGGWWCADVSAECARVFEAKGLNVFNSRDWRYNPLRKCALEGGKVVRVSFDLVGGRHIHRIGNEFYWSEK